jgi:acyl-coenzyme A thioesterase PaaI-like protein
VSDDTPYDDLLQRRLQAAAAFSEQDGPLPSHHPRCFGCGEDAERGMHLVARREGSEVRSEVTFESWQVGAPGIVHGGMVSAACDDFLGFAMYLSPRVGVTRALEVSFVKPALVGVRYALRGWVEDAQERKAWFACEATDPSGVVVFTARALFVNVRETHFQQGIVTP